MATPTTNAQTDETLTRILAILDRAYGEATFKEQHQALALVNGVVEMLRHTIEDFDRGGNDTINWLIIIRALDTVLDRLGPIYAASQCLEDLDRHIAGRRA
jgi:hypothetical protein